MDAIPYANQRALIVGLGREGQALARFLARHGAKVTVTDVRQERELKQRMNELSDLTVDYHLGGHPEALLDADVIFVSPGVPRDIPFLAAARQRGIPLSSETRLFFRLCPAPIIGITGSSGKTTTTSLVGEIMRAAGYRTLVGGNIGSPLINAVDSIAASDKVVMELSSFQLDDLDQSPHIAAVLNLSPNHLDRHSSMDEYVRAKANIVRFQREGDYAVLNADDGLARRLRAQCNGQVLAFSRQQEVDEGAFLRQGGVIVRWAGQEHEVCRLEEIQLRGWHNVENVLAACAIAVVAGAQAEAMSSAVTCFRGVEHRLELVHEVDGVRYYDDSIATSPERTIAALNSFSEPLILLAGGRGKNLPLAELAKLIPAKAKSVVLFGEAGPLLEEAVKKAQSSPGDLTLPFYHATDLGEAVRIAADASEAGDVVLLSPAFTSFDMYRDFAERGDHFKALVRELSHARRQRSRARGENG